MTRLHLAQRILFETIDEVVRFDADAFAPAHLDEGARTVFVAQFEPQLFAGGDGERDHLVAQMHARLFAHFRRDHRHAAPHHLLRVGLARVYDVVDGRPAAEVWTGRDA